MHLHRARIAFALAAFVSATTATRAQIITWNGDDILTVLNPPTVNVGATLNIATGNNHDLRFQTLTNNGTINWSAGYLRGGDGSVILNSAGATFNDQNSLGYTVHNGFGSGTFVFANQGSYVRNVGGTTFFDVPFDNSGTVELQQGAIQFRDGGTMSSTGSMTAAAGTTLQFTNGYTIQNAASLTGAGTFHLSGGTMTLDGAVSVGNFLQSGGVLAGTQTLSNTIFTWNAGSWDAATTGPSTTIASTSTLNIATGSNHDLRRRVVVNEGTVDWTSGYIRGGDGSTFTNAAGATFNDQNSQGYTVHNGFGSGTFVFTNHGTYVRNVGGTTFFDVPFDNTGAVNLQQGAIHFRAGGTLSSTGSMSAAVGTTIQFTSGYTIQNAASLTGAGTFHLSGGTMTLDGAVSVGNFLQSGGVLAGTQTLNNTIFTWNAGSWDAATTGPSTTIANTSTLNIATGSNHDLRRRAVVNQGTVNWTSGYVRGGDGSTFTNAAGATFNDQNSLGYTVQNGFGSGSFVFTNLGNYVRNVGGTTYFDVPFNNSGSVQLLQGDLQFRAGGTLATTGSIAAATGTNVYFTDSYNIDSGASLSGAGTYRLTNGTLSVSGGVSVGNFLQTGGLLAGTQTFNGTTFNWNAGSWDAGAGGPSTTIAADSTLNIASGSNHDLRRRAVTNLGTVNWTSGYIRGGDGSTFTNAAGATFNDQNSQDYTVHNGFGSGTFVFTNQGNYVRNVGGTTYFDVPFNNDGSVSLLQGALAFRAGGTLSGSGSIAAATGTTVTFADSYTIANGASLSGAGTYRLTAGTLEINGQVSVGNFVQTGGVLSGTQTLNGTTFTWNAGTWDTGISGPATTIAAGSTLNIATGSNHDLRRRAIVNQGTVNWTSGYIRGGDGSLFTNAAGATFNDLNSLSYTVHNGFGSGTFEFVNEGTYVRSVGGETFFDVPFTNSGTVVLDEGNLELRAGAMLAPTSVLSFTLGGPTASTDFGLLEISSALTLDGQLRFSFSNGYDTVAHAGQTLTLVTATSLAGGFSNVANGARLLSTDGLGSFQVNYGAGSAFAVNTVVLSNFVQVPEPSTWALLLLGGATVVLAGRRRRAS